MDAGLPRRLAAEAIGTALLIVFGPGSVAAALAVGRGSLDYAGLGVVGLSFGLVVAIVVHAFGTTSGAHINPAVTVVLAATRRFPAGWSGGTGAGSATSTTPTTSAPAGAAETGLPQPVRAGSPSGDDDERQECRA